MNSLYRFKDRVVNIYGKYDIYVKHAVKFISVLVLMFIIRGSIGDNSILGNPGLMLIIALICMFLSEKNIVYLIAIYTAGLIYFVSIEFFAIFVFIILIIVLLYMQYSPEYSYLILLTAIAAIIKIDMAVAVLAGVFLGPAALVPVACGKLIQHMVSHVSEFADSSASKDIGGIVDSVQLIIKNVLLDKSMFIVAIALILTVLVVYYIGKINFEYAWKRAVLIGCAVYTVFVPVCSIIAGISFSPISFIIGIVLSAVIIYFGMFFFRNLEYTKTERVRFEDDEYYYYVKAVPKRKIGILGKSGTEDTDDSEE